MKKLRKIDCIYAFVFLFPLLDFLSFWHPVFYFFDLGLKGIFVIYAVVYLLKNTKHKKIFAFLGIYFFLLICYLLTNHGEFLREFINTLTIFSLPILILFFTHYENEKITKRTMTIVLLLYTLFYLFLLVFKIGNGFSLFSLFSLFVLLFSVVLGYLVESNSYLLKGLFLLLFLLLTLFISAKTFYISLCIILLYYLILNRKNIMAFCKKNQLKTLLAVLAFLLCIIVSMPKTDFVINSKIVSFKETFTYSNLNIIFSGRLDNLSRMQNVYKNSEALEKVFGIGIQKLESTGKVESDIFDLFYSIGFLGLLCYFIFFLYVLKNGKLQKNYQFAFELVLALSFLGNVLVNAYVIPFFALLFLLSKNDKGIMKKDILFVSNMYPNETYPHYGIFVKNTYEILKVEHSVDLVVMYKSVGKIKKLISYVKMCGVSLLKAVFNNYDSIYVHFVSHTPAGVFIPAICSKNTKFVLNVHGNDLVADTNVDQNYLMLTKIFLKGADIVISPSKYFERILEKEYHIPKERIVVYPSGGVDINKFKKINKKTALKNAGLESKYTYFGFIARIEKDKGYDTFVKAIHEFIKKSKKDNVRFLLVGSGSEEEKLNKLIKKYKLEKRIIRKPLVSQEELVNLYNAIDAFVYPTRRKSESLGLTGIEAMACETLVIGSNKLGPSDYLIDKENSLTFTPSNYKELAKKMQEALEMETKERNRLVKNARKKSEEYSSEVTKGILLETFK